MLETSSPTPFASSKPSRSNSLASTVSSSGTSLSRRSRTKTTRRPQRHPQRQTTHSHNADTWNHNDQVLDISAAYSLDSPRLPHTAPPLTRNSIDTSHPIFDRPKPIETHPNGAEVTEKRNKLISHSHSEETAQKGVVDNADPEEQRGRRLKFEESAEMKSLKAKRRVSSLPRLTYPAAYDSTVLEASTRQQIRDSLLTQQSSTASSVYPMSTSTEPRTPSSARSFFVFEEEEEEFEDALSSFDPESPTKQLDTDDVAYRLRLLVKNSYFLPPAHSKPSLSDLIIASPPKKATTPTFLDLFRVGKSKAKATSDVPDKPLVLRVTSDATTITGRTQRERSSTQHSLRANGGTQERVGRVVVVREKMDDLLSAAKQAEQDFKARECRQPLSKGSKNAACDEFDGVIDPTDVVDVPPPSFDYPFAVQASALHRLGVEESVGAAMLAERLPPPGTPGSPGRSMVDLREDIWRKALLQAAVGHSLSNSIASGSVTSTPSRSPRPPHLQSPLPPKATKHFLDQKILKKPVIESSDDTPRMSPTSPVSSSSPHNVICLSIPEATQRLSSAIPLRSETPVPHTPLAPPPRKAICNPVFSRSQTDVSNHSPGAVTDSSHGSRAVLRKSASSPLLYKGNTNGSRVIMAMTPPPMPSLSVSPSPSDYVQASSAMRGSHRLSNMTSISRYTGSDRDEIVAGDEPPSRPSFALSLPTTEDRPSISEYSQPSPTASAFQDRYSEAFYSAASQIHINGGGELITPRRSRESLSSNGPIPRLTTMSPPPRPSSSVANIALSPPPRSVYLPYKPLPSRVQQSNSALSTFPERNSSRSFGSAISNAPHNLVPLSISVETYTPGLHSAPPPASPAAFFDHIQSHPNAMDDLDTSEDSRSDFEQDTDLEVTAVYRPSLRPSLTQLGNPSMPNVQLSTPKSASYSIRSGQNYKKTIGHTLDRPQYFSNRKISPNSVTPLVLASYSSDRIPTAELSPRRRPATTEDENMLQRKKQDDSSKKLDGMLIQHMEAERDHIKRIARTAKGSKPT